MAFPLAGWFRIHLVGFTFLPQQSSTNPRNNKYDPGELPGWRTASSKKANVQHIPWELCPALDDQQKLSLYQLPSGHVKIANIENGPRNSESSH